MFTSFQWALLEDAILLLRLHSSRKISSFVHTNYMARWLSVFSFGLLSWGRSGPIMNEIVMVLACKFFDQIHHWRSTKGFRDSRDIQGPVCWTQQCQRYARQRSSLLVCKSRHRAWECICCERSGCSSFAGTENKFTPSQCARPQPALNLLCEKATSTEGLKSFNASLLKF